MAYTDLPMRVSAAGESRSFSRSLSPGLPPGSRVGLPAPDNVIEENHRSAQQLGFQFLDAVKLTTEINHQSAHFMDLPVIQACWQSLPLPTRLRGTSKGHTIWDFPRLPGVTCLSVYFDLEAQRIVLPHSANPCCRTQWSSVNNGCGGGGGMRVEFSKGYSDSFLTRSQFQVPWQEAASWAQSGYMSQPCPSGCQKQSISVWGSLPGHLCVFHRLQLGLYLSLPLDAVKLVLLGRFGYSFVLLCIPIIELT